MLLLKRLAVLLGGRSWLPAWAPFVVWLDKFLRRISSGHVTLLLLAGIPELFLTVRGARSGKPRTTPLLCTPYRGGWIVVGSNWGAEQPPAWVANLRAADTAVVDVKARSWTVRPHLLEGAERAAAWQAANRNWPNYETYASRTDRELTVWFLEPVH